MSGVDPGAAMAAPSHPAWAEASAGPGLPPLPVRDCASTAAGVGGGLMQRYVAHEFRSQLCVVTGAAMLLSRRWSSQDEKGRRLCAALDESANLLKRMLDDWQRATANSQEFSFNCQRLELRPWLVHWLGSYLATDAPAAASGAPAPGLLLKAADDVAVLVDAQRLSQCLFNLLSNAYKYGGSPASVQLEVHQSGSGVQVVVADAGPGLRPEQLELLFKPFTRLAPDAPVPGEGLGLSLTRLLVEGMGGRISVQSKEGAGTRFTITLRPA